MNIFRTHAYEVTPQRTKDKSTKPRGGTVSANDEFKKALDDFLKKSKLAGQPRFDFRAHSSSSTNGKRTNDVRELVINYCFGAAAPAKSSSYQLAVRLGDAMDERSPFTLLLFVAYEQDARRKLVMWAFPKEEPFHFSTSGKTARVKILKDAFSRTSTFRKAALFEGQRIDGDFWSGRFIDRQSQNGTGTAADYWINGFLDGRLSLTGKTGTILLANCLRAAYDTLTKQTDRDQIADAVVAVHASQRARWSMLGFAAEYLTGNAKATFLSKATPDTRSAPFTIEKQELQRKLNFRVFRHTDGVVVSAPFGTVGHSVKLSGQNHRKLKYEGTVTEEDVRARHA